MNVEGRPLVSIVMPAFNARRYIAEAIGSVKNQTYGDWELLVVDDASTDETADIVRTFQREDPRILYSRNPDNQGVVRSRNNALDMARGRYVAFLDADDAWERCKLERQVSFMEETGVPISYGDYLRVDYDGHVVGKVVAPEILRYDDMLKSNFIGNLTGIFRRSELAGLRFEDIKHEDYLFWLRALARTGPARATPAGEPIARYRVSANSLSANKLKAARWQWRIYRSGLGLSVFRSMGFFLCYTWYAVAKRGIWHKLNR
ncbi:glycosyltransferase family 2 protein [Achromobacter sp. UBA4530]|uniref:glycosyltransferase family 2 protein n=1 Tax=Achromobacter sp. UBA4530 TaxID=1945912 RepID=UPI00257BA81C|nr:glycosyltransferase family 2 protein [Achromobacter sp. UBA4530]